MLFRAVRIINVSIAVLVVLLLIAVYWLAVRPLPKTSGEIRAPVNGAATVRRDARGVPHIEASSWQDAIFLQGFVTAQDRLWQMDVLRRFGGGELAAVFGPAALAEDERVRRMRMREIAEEDVSRLRPEDRALMVEYARGVNYFIDTHRDNYPLEFSLPGHQYDPRDWTMTDSVVVGLVMFRNLTDSAASDFDKGRLLQMCVEPRKFHLLFPAVQGGYVNPGSNAWAVSGAHTADGKPIAANDPHLEYGIPGTWHLVHLKAPGLDVSGAALPGVPGVISGHNRQIAWGVTNLQADVMDLYAEQIDERTGQYAFQGKAEQAQLDRQFIGVKDGKPVQLDTWVTRHGPIVMHQDGKAYSMRWSTADGFGFPFFDIDRAENWQQFRAALSIFWGPCQNFIYADKAGNIGYQAAGRVPIRRNFDGDVPLDGSSGNFEWDGYIPFEQLPNVYNPDGGIAATANQNPFPPGYPYRVNGSYADTYRVDQIRSLLKAKPRLTVDDMLAVQKDVYSAYDFFLAQQIITAFQKNGSNDELIRDAIPVLRKWNGQMEKDQAAPMMMELLSNTMRAALVRGTVETSGRPVQPPNLLPRPSIVESLLNSRPAGWIPGNSWNSWLLQNFASALQEGRKQQGTPVAHWRWGRMLEWKLAHPIGKQLPFVDRFFDIGAVEMSGAGTTVKQTTATLGPSERMVVDFGNIDNSVQNLVAGESGSVASPHYKDQWPAYYTGKSFPMEYDHVDAKEVLRVVPAP